MSQLEGAECVATLDDEETKEPRKRLLSRKALQNAVQERRPKLEILYKRLLSLIKSAEEPGDDCSSTQQILIDLKSTSDEFNNALQELIGLYEQDKHGEFKDESQQVDHYVDILKHGYLVMQRIKLRQSDKLLETRSVRSRLSSRRSARSQSTSSSRASSARIRALAEAEAARKSAEYERLIAEKELERRKREAELQRSREQERAQFENDLAILEANKKVAVADAKLKAIEQALCEEELRDFDKIEKLSLPGMPEGKEHERTFEWVHSTHAQDALNSATHKERESKPQTSSCEPLRNPQAQKQTFVSNETTNLNAIDYARVNSLPFVTSTPSKDVSGAQIIETLTSVNQQVVAGLARQNLPKCHPDTFTGDATLFHPWKSAFKAMIEDANVSPTQEINYLRSFTNGEPQRVVDNYRKRQQNDPVKLLGSLWEELERRFGSAAVVTNTLLERMQKTAVFSEKDNISLQKFADFCADVESQIACLPGLACLNYPNIIQPIANKLPSSTRGKWEKEVARYADKNAAAYPPFSHFTKLVQEQAKIKNNPNILANKEPSFTQPSGFKQPLRENRKTMKTSASPPEVESSGTARSGEVTKIAKRCPFHERDGHDLTECKAFASKPLEERTEWIKTAGLCFRCLKKANHVASNCPQPVQCGICGDKRHISLLHKEKEKAKPSVTSKCTAACGAGQGGISCGKILLVDVFKKANPTKIHRVYALVDEQSNTSLITSELADTLGEDTPPTRYYLSTCSGEDQEKYGRRVSSVVVQSVDGAQAELPTLVECDSIPQDKREIPTPEMARRFEHLKSIADEVPPLDEAAGVHILIGRDAPELLKVRAFKNGTKGAPWAHRLDLGQMCLDLAGGPAHFTSYRTALYPENAQSRSLRTPELGHLELTPCPNKFVLKDGSLEKKLNDDIFALTDEDNEPSLSWEDRKFMNIMERHAHKNKSDHWEMPLPFREENPQMPNNKAQAHNRLNSLLRTLKRNPEMEKDYLEFMEKVFDKGHASPVSQDDSRGIYPISESATLRRNLFV